MKFIKRHKGLLLICVLVLILVGILFAIFSRMIFANGKGEYGDRLNGVKEVSGSVLKEAKDKIKENEIVDSASIRTQGKIIYILITFNDKASKDKAKEVATKSLEYFDEDVINTYDFEFLLDQKLEVKEDEEDKSFAIAGAKHVDAEKITWTRN